MDIITLLESHKKPLIIAHRGGSLIARENTISAYKKSIELSVDIVETDVRETSDGYIVSFHDTNLERLANTKGEIKDFTLEELKKIYPEMPTLEEVLNFCKGRVPVIIEVKEKGFEKKLVKIIEEEKILNEVIILSFKEDVIKKIKELNSEIHVGNLVRVNLLSVNIENFVEKTLELNAKVLCLNFNGFTKKLLEKCHENKVALWLWTVNTQELMKEFIEYGVDGIITDVPDKLIYVFSNIRT